MPLSPREAGLKNAKRKIALHLKKVCYKVSLCEYCQRQSCKAFTGQIYVQKYFAGDVYYVKIGRNWPTHFQSIFARDAAAVSWGKSSINMNKEMHYELSSESKIYCSVRCPEAP